MSIRALIKVCSDAHKRRRKLLFFLTEVQTEKNLLQELFEYFNETYFSPEIPHLQNISLGTGTLISLKMILIGISLGLIFASFVTIYNKRYIGGFVRQLLKDGCHDAKSAKTLEELGYSKKIGIKFALRAGSPLSRWARCIEEDEFYANLNIKRKEFEDAHKDEKNAPKFKEIDFKRNTKTMHFYVPEEKRIAADIKFDAKGANWVSFILVTIISIVLCAFLSFVLPDLIKMIDNFITVVSG